MNAEIQRLINLESIQDTDFVSQSIDYPMRDESRACGLTETEFNDIAAAMYDREDEILNYFVNRSTNASAESLNAKIKHFRAQLRGIIDRKFFPFRLMKIYA